MNLLELSKKFALLSFILILASCKSEIQLVDKGGNSTSTPPAANGDNVGIFKLQAVAPLEAPVAVDIPLIKIIANASESITGCVFSGDRIYGLSYDEVNCEITGKPLVPKTNSTLYVQAYNSSGYSNIIPIKITSYDINDGIITDNKLIATKVTAVNKLISSSGTCTVENPGDLNGLSLNPTTCVLTGTPTQLTAGTQLKFKITAADSSYAYSYLDIVVDEKFTYNTKTYSKLDFVAELELKDLGEKSVYLPIKPGYKYDFIIDWGDGIIEHIDSFYSEKLFHHYEDNNDNPIIIISGRMPGLGSNTNALYPDVNKYVKNIINFGDLSYKNLSYMFNENPYLTEFRPLLNGRHAQIKGVINFSNMFSSTSLLTNISLTGLDFSSATNMTQMFLSTAMTSLDMSGLNLSKVQKMNYMFLGSAITSINLSGLNLSSLQSMNSMFSTSQIASVNFTGSNLSSVKDMSSMFSGSQIASLNLSGLNLSSLQTMNNMFTNSPITSLNLSGLNLSSLQDMGALLANTPITSLNISGTNLSSVKTMNAMFSGSSIASLNLSGLNFSSVEDMNSMFSNSQITSLNLSGLNISSLQNMTAMFANTSITSLDLSGLDLSNVQTMSSMFSNSQITSLDLSGLDLSSLEDMSNMFTSSQITSLDLSGTDLSSVKTMSSMFTYSQIGPLDWSGFNLSSLQDMSHIFSRTSQMTSFKMNNLTAPNLSNISYMFYYSQNIATVEMKNLNLPLVTHVAGLFYQTYAPLTVDFTGTNLSNVTSRNGFFESSTLSAIYCPLGFVPGDVFSNIIYVGPATCQ